MKVNDIAELIIRGCKSNARKHCPYLFTAEIAEDAEMKVNELTEQIVGGVIDHGLSQDLLLNFNVKQLS